MSVQLAARNATAADLVEVLTEQQAHKLDVVVPSTNLKFRDGQLVVKNSEVQINEDGVTQVNGVYRPTEVFDSGVSEKLGIPRQYVRKLRENRVDLLDTNVNGWLHGRSRRAADGSTEELYPADSRSHLVRLFKGDDGGDGVARALLSTKYGLSFDHLDMLTAVQQGINDSGVKVSTRVTNLSERGMRIRFEAPDINTLAPELLGGYKDPFTNGSAPRAGLFDTLRQQYGAHHIFSEKDAPLCFIGFDFTNSETGDGKYRLRPVLGVVKCTNGWIQTKHGVGIERRHYGAELAQGQVSPSLETIRKAGELVRSETKDAVTKWLSREYLEELVGTLTETAKTPLTGNTVETVPAVVASLGFSEDEQKGVLDMFVRGGQMTAGGIAQAVSAFAQTVEDVDRAYEVELKAIEAMEVAARRSA